MRRDIPEPWASALVEAGATDPRNAERPSWQALGRMTGIHASTLIAMATGTRETKQSIVDQVAEALRLSPVVVSEWVGRARSEVEPYTPPDEAHLLDSDERKAIDRLITLMAKGKHNAQKTIPTGGLEPEQPEPPADNRPKGRSRGNWLPDRSNTKK